MALHILPILDHATPPARATTAPAPGSLHGFVVNSRFQFTEKIGAGSYGVIYLVKDLASSAFYAAKITLVDPPGARAGKTPKQDLQQAIYGYFAAHRPLEARELDLGEVEASGAAVPWLREAALQLRVHGHRNVVTIHHVLELGAFAVVAMMEYYPQGDLFGNIIDKHMFSQPPAHQDKTLLIKNCMLQLVDVVAHCARKGVYHCDLKPENIMVCYNRTHTRARGAPVVDYAELQIGLIDFGLASTAALVCCNVCRGSSFYMAPERIVNFSTSRLVHSLLDMARFSTCAGACAPSESTYFPTLAGDVWSLGVLFVNLACARNPWPVANINDRREVFHNYIVNDRGLLRRILPISRQFADLLGDVFVLDPTRRASLAGLASRIAACSLYDDVLEFNGQMYTPPACSRSKAASPAPSMEADAVTLARACK